MYWEMIAWYPVTSPICGTTAKSDNRFMTRTKNSMAVLPTSARKVKRIRLFWKQIRKPAAYKRLRLLILHRYCTSTSVIPNRNFHIRDPLQQCSSGTHLYPFVQSCHICPCLAFDNHFCDPVLDEHDSRIWNTIVMTR